MTVSWADVQNAIKEGIVSLDAAAAGATVWADEPRPAAKVLFILDLVSMAALQDRECNVLNPDTDLWEWRLSTLYYIRIQVRAESVYNAPGSDALFALERVRAGLRRPDLTWGAGIVNQPDNATYIHHVSFEHQGRTISAYSFETGFRAVIDYPLTGVQPPAPNMTRVILDDTEVEIGEDDPVSLDQQIDRT